MPDLAVEIKSPSESMPQMRRKARLYLEKGTLMVWLVLPGRQSVEVWQRGAAGEITSEMIERDGTLSGGAVLPGFALPLRRLFD